MAHRFFGTDWIELAECWGITYSEGETISTQVLINSQKFDVVFAERDAVMLQKIKTYLYDNLVLDEEGEFILDKKVKSELIDFTTKLAVFSEDESHILRAIAQQKSDWHLVKWVCRNLDNFWV